MPETERPYVVTIRGRTQANRTVVVRSETSGVVAATPVLQGTAVKAGALLCRLAVDGLAEPRRPRFPLADPGVE